MERVSVTQSITPHERLIAAVLVLAWKDAHGRNPERRAEALAWLESGGADNVAAWLDIPADRLRRLTAD